MMIILPLVKMGFHLFRDNPGIKGLCGKNGAEKSDICCLNVGNRLLFTSGDRNSKFPDFIPVPEAFRPADTKPFLKGVIPETVDGKKGPGIKIAKGITAGANTGQKNRTVPDSSPKTPSYGHGIRWGFFSPGRTEESPSRGDRFSHQTVRAQL